MVCLVQAMIFPAVMYGWELYHKEGQGIDVSNLVLEKTLESPLDSKRSNQSTLTEINPEYSREGLMLKLKLQYFDYLMQRVNQGTDPDAGKDWWQKKKGEVENEKVR